MPPAADSASNQDFSVRPLHRRSAGGEGELRGSVSVLWDAAGALKTAVISFHQD